MHAHQRPPSPERGNAEDNKKCQPNGAPGHRALAPTLEHGDQSNYEKQDCARSDPFHEHVGHLR